MTPQIRTGKQTNTLNLIHQPIFSRKASLEVRKQARIIESNRSIESVQQELQTERSRLNHALGQYRPQGSWSNKLEKLIRELVEVEQQELDDHEQIAHYLQRLEELDDQVGNSTPSSKDNGPGG